MTSEIYVMDHLGVFYEDWNCIHFDSIYALKNVRFFANLTILESMKNSDLLREA